MSRATRTRLTSGEVAPGRVMAEVTRTCDELDHHAEIDVRYADV